MHIQSRIYNFAKDIQTLILKTLSTKPFEISQLSTVAKSKIIMDIIEVRDFILSLPAAEETQPFDDEHVVYKIGGKWFAVVDLEKPDNLAVKCDPDRAIQLRDKYAAITEAWHFNKRHWNHLSIERLTDAILTREIRHSYLTVIRKNVAPKALRVQLLADAQAAGIDDAKEI